MFNTPDVLVRFRSHQLMMKNVWRAGNQRYSLSWTSIGMDACLCSKKICEILFFICKSQTENDLARGTVVGWTPSMRLSSLSFSPWPWGNSFGGNEYIPLMYLLMQDDRTKTRKERHKREEVPVRESLCHILFYLDKKEESSCTFGGTNWCFGYHII